VEGSVHSSGDLQRCRAEAAAAALVLADRFTPDSASEDTDVLFRVWALKSYTNTLPLYVQVGLGGGALGGRAQLQAPSSPPAGQVRSSCVARSWTHAPPPLPPPALWQVLRSASLARVAPFLNPQQDVLLATEQLRHRLLALAVLVPGGATLVVNLLRGLAASSRKPRRPGVRQAGSATIAPAGGRHAAAPATSTPAAPAAAGGRERLCKGCPWARAPAPDWRPLPSPPAPPSGDLVAGRRWLTEYVDGCAQGVFSAPLGAPLAGRSFTQAAQHVLQAHGVVLLGLVLPGGQVRLNPGPGAVLQPGQRLLVLAGTQARADEALQGGGQAGGGAPQRRQRGGLLGLPRALLGWGGKGSGGRGERQEEQREQEQQEEARQLAPAAAGAPRAAGPAAPGGPGPEANRAPLHEPRAPQLLPAPPQAQAAQLPQAQPGQRADGPLWVDPEEGCVMPWALAASWESESLDEGDLPPICSSGEGEGEQEEEPQGGGGRVQPAALGSAAAREGRGASAASAAEQQQQQQQQQQQGPQGPQGASAVEPEGGSAQQRSKQQLLHQMRERLEQPGPAQAQAPSPQQQQAQLAPVHLDLGSAGGSGADLQGRRGQQGSSSGGGGHSNGSSSDRGGGGLPAALRDHIILCGAADSFEGFARQLHLSGGGGGGAGAGAIPLLLLHPTFPAQTFDSLSALGPVYYVQGSPSELQALQEAHAPTAR
jgi:hypothetical protein